MKIEAKSRALDKVFKRRDRYEIPDWQREEVWPESKKQYLIDSILRGGGHRCSSTSDPTPRFDKDGKV
jgi:uncharacterized protein with ParB-like and HNH nuclease domain